MTADGRHAGGRGRGCKTTVEWGRMSDWSGKTPGGSQAKWQWKKQWWHTVVCGRVR